MSLIIYYTLNSTCPMIRECLCDWQQELSIFTVSSDIYCNLMTSKCQTIYYIVTWDQCHTNFFYIVFFLSWIKPTVGFWVRVKYSLYCTVCNKNLQRFSALIKVENFLFCAVLVSAENISAKTKSFAKVCEPVALGCSLHSDTGTLKPIVNPVIRCTCEPIQYTYVQQLGNCEHGNVYLVFSIQTCYLFSLKKMGRKRT